MLFCILGIQSGKFAHFDLGKIGNIKKYGQETPPEFSIEAMNVPIASYWSQDDWMAQPPGMAIRVVEFSNGGYKIRKKIALESTHS